VPVDPLRLTLLLAPLFAIGAASGVLRGLALREPPGTRRRRAFSAAWVGVLLGAAPLWLILAALLRLW
jgi:hypothetical protein